MIKKINLNSYAKINISLDVTGIRENGYHEVSMIMQAVDLYDEITVSIISAEENSIKLTTTSEDIPTDIKNTAYKAAQIIVNEFLTENKYEIKIHIKKNIPAAAGMAGGSSNAAGVLIALNSLLNLGLNLKDLCSIGLRIGADVPFCIMSLADAEPKFNLEGGATCSLAEGIGEILSPLPPVKMWSVLAKPPIGVSTAEVYKSIDEIKDYNHPDTESVIKGIKEQDISLIKAGMGNVLENITLRDYPEVAELKAIMKGAGDGLTMMSGSGPTVFSLYEDREKAEIAFEKLKVQLRGKKYDVFCVSNLY